MSDPTAFDALERSLAAVVRRFADRAATGELARRCGYDLPPASWALMEHLDEHGPLRVSDIAACHGVDVSSITPRLKRLERDGLVVRGRVSTDRRASLISIAPEGSRALQHVHSVRREILSQALRDADPAQVAAAAGVLGCVAAHLNAETLTRPAL